MYKRCQYPLFITDLCKQHFVISWTRTNLCDVTDRQFYESPERCILNATCVACSLL